MSKKEINLCGPGDLPSGELLSGGERALRWIGDYLDRTRDHPVRARAAEGDLLADLPEEMPEDGESLERIERDFRELVVPRVTHWNHPRFFAYFAISGSVPGILGELYSAALNTNGMKWVTNPASAELEQRTLRWLARGLGLPDGFHGIMADAASTATLLSLTVGREKATGFDVRRKGLYGQESPLRLYCSEEAHMSVEKAAVILGLGLDHVVRVPSDRNYRMDVAALRESVRVDRGAGRSPFAVVATLGTTAANGVDPMHGIADLCEEENLWLHADGAYAGAAAFLPEKRGLFAGWERADTIVVNPHKWIFTPVDASAFYFKDAEAFRRAFSILPEYLRTGERADDPMDYGFQLGRRFRALKLWFVLRAFGRKGIEERIRFHCDLARRFADWVDGEEEWERLAPTPFSTVCFRHRGGGGTTKGEEELVAKNGSILEGINRSGDAYLSHAVLKGRYALRVTIGNIRTTADDVDLVRRRLVEEAVKL
ncbi:MAG: pyridoxal-dependent decarboxylase [Candidatus Eisenbacteria bacterium]